MTVYLCGGINGLGDDQAKDWREAAKETLRCKTLDPMRRDYRGVEDSNVYAIVQGDLEDITASDAVLVNATRPSWGTAMELVYASQQNKLIVAYTEGARISPWLRHHCTHLFGWLARGGVFPESRGRQARIAERTARDPETGRAFDGRYDEASNCGCVEFYHGGISRCEAHSA